MNKNNYFFSFTIYILFYCSTLFSESADNLIKKIDEATQKVFFNKPISNLAKDVIEVGKENNQSKYSEFTKVIEEAGQFIKNSGSKELPPIYEKYFKPRYFGLTSDNDLITILFSINQLNNSKKTEDSNKKLELLKDISNKKINVLDDELKKVGKSYRDSTAQAKKLLTYLTYTVLPKIRDLVYLEKHDPQKNLILFIKGLEEDPKKMEIFRLTLSEQLKDNSPFINEVVSLMAGYEGFEYEKVAQLNRYSVFSKNMRWSEDSNYIFIYDNPPRNNPSNWNLYFWDLRDKSQKSYGLQKYIYSNESKDLYYKYNDSFKIKFIDIPEGKWSSVTGAYVTKDYFDLKEINVQNNEISTIAQIKYLDLMDEYLLYEGSNILKSPTGKYIIVGYGDKIKIWDIQNKPRLIFSESNKSFFIDRVSWSNNENYAVVAGKSKMVIIDLKNTNNIKKIIPCVNEKIINCNISGNGNRIIDADIKNPTTIKVYDFDINNLNNCRAIQTISYSTNYQDNKLLYLAEMTPYINTNGKYFIIRVSSQMMLLFAAKTPTWLLNLANEYGYKEGKSDRIGIKKYLLLKAILDNKKNQEKENIKDIKPLEISTSILKDIFNALPGAMQKKFVDYGYVKSK